jgi:argonaute-like protein implicated in RNA metabolism and viral defense
MAMATTGRVYRSTSQGIQDYYPGIGTPQPLLLTSQVPSVDLLQRYSCSERQFYGIEMLARHVMALTQLHWGSIKDNIRLPITTLYAHKVADLISKTGAAVDTWSSYHRPWFL